MVSCKLDNIEERLIMKDYVNFAVFTDKYYHDSRYREYSRKPKNNGQLFLRDLFKLEENTELFVVSGDTGEENIKTPAQFIKMKLNKETKPGIWCIAIRDEDGVEYAADLFDLGALSWNGTWLHDHWLTLKE